MERVLHVNKKRTQWVIALCVLAMLCLLLIALIRHAALSSALWGLFCGATAIAVYAMRLHHGVVYLKLTDQGFEYKYYWPARFVAWNDVQRFTTYLYKFHRYVGWNYSAHYSGTKLPFANLMGIEGRFFENFDHKPKDLASLLEEWRQKNSDVF